MCRAALQLVLGVLPRYCLWQGQHVLRLYWQRGGACARGVVQVFKQALLHSTHSWPAPKPDITTRVVFSVGRKGRGTNRAPLRDLALHNSGSLQRLLIRYSINILPISCNISRCKGGEMLLKSINSKV